jgi:hypothetical protein
MHQVASTAPIPPPSLYFHDYRNDRISLITVDKGEENADFHELAWLPTLRSHRIGLLILNRGAHYEPTVKVLQEVNATLSYLHEHHSNVSIIWRNTPQGHHETLSTRPVGTDPFHYSLLNTSEVKEMCDKSPADWGWRHFAEQNEAIKK